MSKIACGIIAYNAAANLPKLIPSLKGHIDLLVLGIDKKTTDDTKRVAEELCAKNKIPLITHEFLLEDSEDSPKGPKNFDRARNENWALFPKDFDWGFWLDSDDVLYSDVDLHKIADEQPEEVSQVWFQYAYFRNEFGNVTTHFWRERLVRLKIPGKWIRRLHEICISEKGVHARDARAWIEHENRLEESSKGERNFATLYAILDENPKDPWANLYLGLQFFGAQQYDLAAQQFLQFVPLVADIGERWQALVYASKAFRMGKNFQAAESAALGALKEYPIWADPYYELSAVYAEMAVSSKDGNSQRAYAAKSIQWYEEGQKHPPLDDPRLLRNPLDYDYNPAATVQVCYQIVGQLETAMGLLDKSIGINPDPRLIEVRDTYAKVLDRRQAIVGGLTLARHLYSNGEPLKAKEVLFALPVGAESETDSVNQARVGISHELAFTKNDNSYENRYFLDPEETEADPDNPTQEDRWLLSALKRAGAKRVLDFGIGNGQTDIFLAKHGIQVVGLDVDPRRVKQANMAAVKFGLLRKAYRESAGRSVPILENHGRPIYDLPVQFWYGSIEKSQQIKLGAKHQVSVQDMGPFDAVLLDGLLHRVREPERALAIAESFAPRVFATVPDGADLNYKPQKGSLRALGLYDIEGMVVERGTIIDSHALGDRIALQYTPGIAPHQNADPAPTAVIFCGPGWERWTPDQIDEKGLGGSETAVVKLAEEMVRRGMRVMVYAEAEGTWNGVHYRRYDKFNPQASVWMFIAWRNPSIFDYPIAANLKYLWMHDTDCGDALTPERAGKIDSILVLSKWHLQHMRQKYALDESKFTIIGNGLDASRFGAVQEKENRVIYSSSPDRGLEQALTYWPEIQKRTGAEFHIFYDFNNYDLMGGDPAFKKKILELARQDGVVWRGRIGQQQLAEEMGKAKALFYPGPHPFQETFCITALEAQAAGCVPVTRDNGALPETNKFGIVLPNDSRPKHWFAALQEALNASGSDRTKMREWALEQTWQKVCDRVIERSISIDSERQQQETPIAS